MILDRIYTITAMPQHQDRDIVIATPINQLHKATRGTDKTIGEDQRYD
jgi:hypothetical protein